MDNSDQFNHVTLFKKKLQEGCRADCRSNKDKLIGNHMEHEEESEMIELESSRKYISVLN